MIGKGRCLPVGGMVEGPTPCRFQLIIRARLLFLPATAKPTDFLVGRKFWWSSPWIVRPVLRFDSTSCSCCELLASNPSNSIRFDSVPLPSLVHGCLDHHHQHRRRRDMRRRRICVGRGAVAPRPRRRQRLPAGGDGLLLAAVLRLRPRLHRALPRLRRAPPPPDRALPLGQGRAPPKPAGAPRAGDARPAARRGRGGGAAARRPRRRPLRLPRHRHGQGLGSLLPGLPLPLGRLDRRQPHRLPDLLLREYPGCADPPGIVSEIPRMRRHIHEVRLPEPAHVRDGVREVLHEMLHQGQGLGHGDTQGSMTSLRHIASLASTRIRLDLI